MFRSCILAFNDGELESYLLVNMQWSFEMVQDCLQLTKSIVKHGVLILCFRGFFRFSCGQIPTSNNANLFQQKLLTLEIHMLTVLPNLSIWMASKPKHICLQSLSLWNLKVQNAWGLQIRIEDLFSCHCLPGRPSVVFTSSWEGFRSQSPRCSTQRMTHISNDRNQ